MACIPVATNRYARSGHSLLLANLHLQWPWRRLRATVVAGEVIMHSTHFLIASILGRCAQGQNAVCEDGPGARPSG